MTKPSTQRRDTSRVGGPIQHGHVYGSDRDDEDQVISQVDDADEVEEGDEGDNTSALLSRIAALEGSIERQRKTNLALMAQAPVAAPPVQMEAPTLDLSNMPDAYSEPDRYQQELSRRTQAYLDRQVQARTAAGPDVAALQARTNALWEDFVEEYPEYADKQDAVQFVASKLVQKMQLRGVDPQRYVFGATEDFFEDVDKEFKKQFGKGGKKRSKAEDVVEDDASDADEPDTSRVDGLFNGTVKSPKPRKKGKSDDDSPGDYASEMFEVQRKMGIF